MAVDTSVWVFGSVGGTGCVGGIAAAWDNTNLGTSCVAGTATAARDSSDLGTICDGMN